MVKFNAPLTVFFPVPLIVPLFQVSLLEIVNAPVPLRVPPLMTIGADQVETAETATVEYSRDKMPAPATLLPVLKL